MLHGTGGGWTASDRSFSFRTLREGLELVSRMRDLVEAIREVVQTQGSSNRSLCFISS